MESAAPEPESGSGAPYLTAGVSTVSRVVRLAEDGQYFEQLRRNVASAAEKFDPALMAQKHDEAYREALQESGLKAIA